jgi:tetratricopeptide (TPR) repeat protein
VTASSTAKGDSKGGAATGPRSTSKGGSKVKASGAHRRLDPDELAALEEERDFLLASLADLDREHDAGDLDDDDHAALRDDYTARAAEVLRAIDERREAFAAATPTRPAGRRWAVAVGVVVVALLAGVLVAQASGRRSANQTVTGDIRRTPTQQAQACLPLTFQTREDPEKVLEAQKCYKAVLDDDPRNPTALTYLGWALLLTGDQRLVEPGRGYLQRSVEAAPEYPDAYAFLAILESRLGNYPQADKWLDTFESLDPAPDMLRLTEGLRAEIDAGLAGAPPPADPGAATISTPQPTQTPGG